MDISKQDSKRANTAFKEALHTVGGHSALARKMEEKGVCLTRQCVFAWNRVPLRYVRLVSKITDIPAIEFVPEVSV